MIAEQLSTLNPPPNARSLELIQNLCSYVAPEPAQEFPRKRLAAVLVLLSIDTNGDLIVTLTTRSMSLRSHPGETALPGGRMDTADANVRETALREAHEEIGLPLEAPLLYLTTLPATTSRTLLVVMPVIYLLAPKGSTSAQTIVSAFQPNPSEVSAIFQVPLLSVLSSTSTSTLVSKSTDNIDNMLPFDYSYRDLTWLDDKPYRLHRFAPTAPKDGDKSTYIPHSAITGLTADLIISTAFVAMHGEEDDESEVLNSINAEGASNSLDFEMLYGFKRRAPDGLKWNEIVDLALQIEDFKMVGLTDLRTSRT